MTHVELYARHQCSYCSLEAIGDVIERGALFARVCASHVEHGKRRAVVHSADALMAIAEITEAQS